MTDAACPATPYAAWIATYVGGSVRGRCVAWTARMQQAFPELRRVWGLVTRMDLPPPQAAAWLQGHCWLVDPRGAIVDPTRRQFPWPLVYLSYPAATYDARDLRREKTA